MFIWLWYVAHCFEICSPKMRQGNRNLFKIYVLVEKLIIFFCFHCVSSSVSYFIFLLSFVHNYGNGQNVFICVPRERENQCSNKSTKHLKTFTPNFHSLISKCISIYLAGIWCRKKKWYNLFSGNIPNGKNVAFRRSKKSTIN